MLLSFTYCVPHNINHMLVNYFKTLLNQIFTTYIDFITLFFAPNINSSSIINNSSNLRVVNVFSHFYCVVIMCLSTHNLIIKKYLLIWMIFWMLWQTFTLSGPWAIVVNAMLHSSAYYGNYYISTSIFLYLKGSINKI